MKSCKLDNKHGHRLLTFVCLPRKTRTAAYHFSFRYCELISSLVSSTVVFELEKVTLQIVIPLCSCFRYSIMSFQRIRCIDLYILPADVQEVEE